MWTQYCHTRYGLTTKLALVQSWTLNNTNLPSGISFGSSNGTLYGTATQLWTTTAYKVWANNTGGSVVAYFNLTVNDEVPSDITYSPENVTLTNNTASSDLPLVPSVTGSGAITSWTLNNTNLPTGISFGSANGTLYGTATQLWTRTSYKVWANNSGGSVVAYFNLTVNDQVPTGFSYSPENLTLTNNTANSNLPLAPSMSGSGAITSWAINASLPSGLSFGTNNGTIYGTPTELQNRTTYKVWANNTGGSIVAYFNLTVNDQVPTVSYSATVLLLTNNTASSDLPHAPIITGSGVITSWEINATLPSGLSFGSNNGTIYGIPTELWPSKSYTIWGNNSGGTTASTVSITVYDQVPTISYNPENVTLVKDTASTDLPLTPAILGSGVITSWVLNNTNLPSGISFGSSNGTLYGTATQLWNTTAYKVWANNSGGSEEVFFNLTVIDQVPSSITYSPENVTLTNNTASSDLPLVPSITGSGSITSWELNNTNLPTGISFGSSNGTLYGTATQLWTRTSYKVWANNTGGSVVAYFNLTVNDQIPTLSYSPNTLVLTKGNQSSDLPLNATLTGSGAITSWAISSTLPAGLNFGTSNGTIWGIPTVLQTTAVIYTIWANNTGGSSTTTVTITINDAAPGPVEYNPENNTLTNNTYVNLEPDFINITTGNGSSWSMPAGTFHPFADSSGTPCLSHIHNGTLYTSATNGTGTTTYLYGYGLSNATAWVVNSTVTGPGCMYVGLGMAGGAFGKTPDMVYGTSLYFVASESSWRGFFGFGLENNTLWKVAAADPTPDTFFVAMDDVIYFSEYHSSSIGHELHAVNVSNGTKWLVEDINSGSGNGMYQGAPPPVVLGDEFVFNAYENSVWGTYVHNTSNESTWRISTEEMYSEQAGVFGDVVYFMEDLSVGNGRKLNAYNASNNTHWQVHDIVSECSPSVINMEDIMYYCANSGVSVTSSNTANNALWAHNPSNGSTWMIGGSEARIQGEYVEANGRLFYRVYGNELWTYEPSNGTAWKVTDASPNGESFTSLGNTVYFTSETDPISAEHNLWAYNTANESTWFVTNISASNWGWTSSGSIAHPEVTSLIFAGDTIYIREGGGMRAHQPASINYQTNTGGAVTSWAINASLPTGLTFSTTNGSIYGTPTQLWTQTSYMVWANNSGGSTMAYLNITVVDEVPTLSYSPENLTLTKNQTSSDLPLNAVLTGAGAITSWEISPALPGGLSFGTSNGTIWGTPTTIRSLRTYTIWANNSGGSSSATVNITVNDELPNISYSPDWFVLTNNTAMSPTATPTNTGGAIPSTTIDSNDNAGVYNSIALDSNGYRHVTYSSQPSGSARTLMYATDASGTWVSITLDSTGDVGVSPRIVIDSDDNIHITYFRADSGNKGIKYATCSSSCSSVSSWTNSKIISFTTTSTTQYLTLSIDSNDDLHLIYFEGPHSSGNLKYATCSSSCATESSWTNITIDGTSQAGYGGIDLVIDSSDHLHVAYSLYSTRDLQYITCSSSCTSVSSWTNLSIDSSGQVGRMPSIAVDSNDDLHISYYDDTGSGLKYAWCSSSCTTVSSWSNTSIANGSSYGIISHQVGFYSDLAFDSDGHMHITHIDWYYSQLLYSTCSSSCSTNSSWSHSVLVSNPDVIHEQHLVIDSNDELNIVFYDADDEDLEFMLLDSSSQPYEYSISPDLPTGLSINPTTGTISGTPTELSTNTTYTITVRNSGGVNTTTITIEVIDNVPTVSYSPENLTLTNNTASPNLPLVPTITGSGAITSWALNNTSLPSGISFSTNNGTFSGTPTELWPTQAYMVWANNTGGSVVAYLNITVNDQIPTLSYTPSTLVLTINNQSSDLPLNATLTGSGEITSWAINATLPAGLNFGTSNGTIWGIPTVLQTTA